MPRFICPKVTLVHPVDAPNRGPAGFFAMGTGWVGMHMVLDTDLRMLEIQFEKGGPVDFVPFENIRIARRGVLAASPKDAKDAK